MKRLGTQLLCGLLVLLLAPGLAIAQEGTVSGVVTDGDTGEPLPGASVVISELDTGTSTAADGTFTLDGIPTGEYDVTFSFIGYNTEQVPVNVEAGEVAELDVTLFADAAELDEVVVIGYGERTRRDVSGSVSSVRATDIEGRAIVSADQALQGAASGVRVTASSGEPGGGLDIRIRGTGSISAGNQPLFVVDGVPINSDDDIGGQASTNPLAGIRAQDIESIDVLKDASAAAIYGAQAANGVVLITTKRGEAGETRIEFDASVGAVESTQTFDMMDSQEWLTVYREAFANAGFPAAAADANLVAGLPVQGSDRTQDEILAEEGIQGLPTYDWQDASLQQGLLQEYGITASGGTEDTRFRVSASYDFREGQYIRSDFDRWALRANLDHNASDRLSFQTNVSLSTQEQQGSIRDGNFINGVLFGAPLVAPNIPIYLDDDQEVFQDEGLWRFGNPIQAVSLEDRFQKTRRILANASARYQIQDNLSFRLAGGIDYALYRDRNYRPPVGFYASDGGTSFEASREVTNFNINPVFNFSDQFDGSHNLAVTAGGEYRREFREDHSVNAQGFISPLFRTINTAGDITNGAGFSTEFRIAGVFGRTEYNYEQRYYATASIRSDASSRFGAEDRWGVFYSGSIGWDISQEAFMDDVGWIDQLRPNISYGTTGNAEIGNFASRGLFSPSSSYLGSPDLRPSQLANPFLTWEESESLNASLESSFWGGRLSTNVEVYRTTNSSLLLDRELSTDSGFSQITENVGRVRNEGVEIDISTVNVDLSNVDFSWRTDFNVAFQRNEVLELATPEQERFGTGTGGNAAQVPETILVGEPIHVFYAPEFAGVNPADGRPMWFDADGNITYNPDGIADAQVVGSPFPDVTGGMRNSFAYSGISLDVFFQFDLGADAWTQQQTFFYETPQFQGNLTRNMLDRWQAPGDITPIPKPHIFGSEDGVAEERQASSRHVRDRSFVRLKSLRLAYQVPFELTNPLGIEALEIYGQGENLLTFTEYDGLDPEIIATQAGNYPAGRAFRAGVTVNF